MSGWILKHVKAKQRNNKLIHLNNYLGSLAVQRLYTDSSSFELTQWRQIKDTSVTCSLSHSLFPDYAFYVSRPPLFASRWKSRLIFRRSGCGAHKSPLVCLISVPNRKLGEMDQGSTPNFLRSAVFVNLSKDIGRLCVCVCQIIFLIFYKIVTCVVNVLTLHGRLQRTCCSLELNDSRL